MAPTQLLVSGAYGTMPPIYLPSRATLLEH
jgi:hypothetical protein